MVDKSNDVYYQMLTGEIRRRAETDRLRCLGFSDVRTISLFALAYFSMEYDTQTVLLLFDKKTRLTSLSVLTRGRQFPFDALCDEIATAAKRKAATRAAVICNYHASPSPDEVMQVSRLFSSLSECGITLADFVLTDADATFSFAKEYF